MKTARGNVDQLFPYKCTTPNGDKRSVVGWREFGGGESRDKQVEVKVECYRPLTKIHKT